ncbi:NDP-sugar synthase [archaeon]|nr:NDP-sugar synthase [archaeon]
MQAVILAAGASSRFVPYTERGHKALFEIMGKPFIDYTFESLGRAGITDIILIVSPDSPLKKLENKAKIIIQKKPEGMGNALEQCKDLLEEQFVLISPYYFNAEDFIKPMLEKSKETNAQLVLAAQKTSTPWKYGMLKLEGDQATGIIEKPEKGKEPSDLKTQSIYLLPREIMEYHSLVKKHQYSFEDALQLYMTKNNVQVVKRGISTASIKYSWDILDALDKLLNRYLGNYIAKSAKIASSAKIEGKVFIGENTRIFENAVIKGPCYIGHNCVIGNNALVRNHSCLEEGVKIGANTEVKHSHLGKGTSIHSGFVGDSVIGSNCKIGAGFVTGNRRIDRANIPVVVKEKKIDSGESFLGTIIGNKTKIGIHCSTMPGVIIGNDCIIGPDTQVAKNVPSKTKYYTKFKEIIEKVN